MRVNRVVIVVIIMWVASCKPTQVTTSTTTKEPYREDLSIHRPELMDSGVAANYNQSDQNQPMASGELKGHIKTEMDSVNTLIAERNKSLGYIEGYTIQVYTGTDRQKADEALEIAMTLGDEFDPKITYRQPSYKVKVGHYTNRLEAHEVFQSLKPYFPNALMIPERISR